VKAKGPSAWRKKKTPVWISYPSEEGIGLDGKCGDEVKIDPDKGKQKIATLDCLLLWNVHNEEIGGKKQGRYE